MTLRTGLRFFIAVCLAVICYLLWYGYHASIPSANSDEVEEVPSSTDPNASPGRYDEHARSSDLANDIKLMWETQPLKGNAGPEAGNNPRASTDRAINAASRVFNTVELLGKSRAEVIAVLGATNSNDSIYNFPFHPAQKGAMVFRFDCGSYGWQFNLIMKDEKVSEVKRLWIY